MTRTEKQQGILGALFEFENMSVSNLAPREVGRQCRARSGARSAHVFSTFAKFVRVVRGQRDN